MGEEKPIIIQLYANLTSNPLLHKSCFCWVLKSHFIGNIDLWIWNYADSFWPFVESQKQILLTLTHTLPVIFTGRSKFLINTFTRPWSVHIFSSHWLIHFLLSSLGETNSWSKLSQDLDQFIYSLSMAQCCQFREWGENESSVLKLNGLNWHFLLLSLTFDH